MRRRRFLGAVAIGGSFTVAGCLDRGGDRGTSAEPLDDSQVTTTGGEAIEFLVAQMVIRNSADGPRVYYQLRNDAEADATIEIRTVLTIEDGGTYEGRAVVEVPAGQEIFVEYPIVDFEVLSAEERTNVERGDADFVTYVNGRKRSDV